MDGSSINRRILKYIDEYDTQEDVKQFLKWALTFELERIWEGRVQYKVDYERNILSHIKDDG